MPVRGNPRGLHQKFLFTVSVTPPWASAAFQKCSELSVEIAEVSYWEGGSLIPIKDPGRLTFADITLERGASDDLDFYTWARDTANAARGRSGGGRGTGLLEVKKNLGIEQRDRNDDVLRTWQVFNAWPKKMVAGEWDNTTDEATLEMLTLGYDYHQLQQ